MLWKTSQLSQAFPFTCSVERLTLHTSFEQPKRLIQDVYKLIAERTTPSKRVKATIPNTPTSLFLKSSPLESWKSKARLTLGMQRPLKNGGGYDWPLEELLNSLYAKKIEAPSAPILGFGYIRHRLGWVEEFFLLTEQLSQHIDGRNWLTTEGAEPNDLISRALSLIVELHKNNFIHLDPWIANFMLDPKNPDDIRIIDLENCFRAQTQYFQETLGIQFGILYRQEVNNHMTEESFDELVRYVIYSNDIECDDRFWQSYLIAKREKISRKSRRKTPIKGIILPG